MTGLPTVWGADPQEARRTYPADLLIPGPRLSMTRAVSVQAPVEVTWRWLCQLAVAPYSYDWIDNRGRQSPGSLTPGADQLVVGQRIAVVLDLVSFAAPHQWTGLTHPSAERLFGPVAMTYAAEPAAAGSRLVCRVVVSDRTRAARARAQLLAWGDLVMMRRQLLRLAELAGRDARR